MTPDRENNRRGFIPLAMVALVVLLAFAFRVYRLEHQDIWGDEALSAHISAMSLTDIPTARASVHPPLYYALLHGWTRLVGQDPYALRFLSVLISTIVVAVMFPFARRFLDRRAALVAVLIVAISSFHVYYAQEARMYGLITLLAMLTVLTAQRVLDAPHERGHWLAFLAIATAAIYTHYYAFFVLLALNIFVLAQWWQRRPQLTRWLVSQALLGAAYIPWALIQTGVLAGQAQGRLEELSLAGLWRIVGPSLAAFSVGTTVAGSTFSWISIGVTFIAALGAARLLRRPPKRPNGVLLLLYLLVPIAVAWLTTPLMPFFFERFLLLVTPAYYLLLAAGLLSSSSRGNWLMLVGLALVIGANAYSLRNYFTDPTYAKGGYGRLMRHITDHAQPGDAIVMNNPDQASIFDYYRPEDIPAYMFPGTYPPEDPRTAADLATISEQHQRVWLIIFGNPAPYDPEHFIERWLSQHGAKSYHGDYVDAGLELFTMTGRNALEEQPLRANFAGKIDLLGYRVAPRVVPGGTLLLSLHWRASAPIERRYTVFTHLLDPGGTVVAQMDSEPVGGTSPTNEWLPGQDIWDNYGLEVSGNAPPGAYAIEIGWYDLPTLERLPVLDEAGNRSGDHVRLGNVWVGDATTRDEPPAAKTAESAPAYPRPADSAEPQAYPGTKRPTRIRTSRRALFPYVERIVPVGTRGQAPSPPRGDTPPDAGPCAGIAVREGGQLVIDGQPFFFYGINVQYLLEPSFPESEVEPIVSALSERGVNTLRVWFFHYHDADRFERLLDAGQTHGVRFVVSLQDNAMKGVDWFFGPEDEEQYRPHVERTVARFHDRPEILFWEVANEPNCGEGRHDDDCLKRIRDWITMASRNIKAIDHCRVVSTGMIGDGNYDEEERSFRLIHGKESIGIISAHKRSIDESESELELANDKGLPIYYGEIYDQAYDDGCNPLSGSQSLGERAQRVKEDLRRALKDGADGYLLWDYSAGLVTQTGGEVEDYCGVFGYEQDDPLWGKIMRSEGLPPPVPWRVGP